MECPVEPCAEDFVHALERRPDHAEFVCSGGCDERVVRKKLLDAQALACDVHRPPALAVIAGGAGSVPPAQARSAAWLEPASALLAEDDPGPPPFLVEDVLMESVVATLLGSAKAGKTWCSLELALAVVTGEPAFGRYAVPKPRPAIVVLEESGRAALRRRLDALARGRGTRADQLSDLHLAANRRVRLDDRGWRDALLEAGRELRPRLIVLDPLVRLKGAVDEDSQREMAPVLDHMRDLRDATGAAVLFVHHSGHEGRRLRGTSDLDASLALEIEKEAPDAGEGLSGSEPIAQERVNQIFHTTIQGSVGAFAAGSQEFTQTVEQVVPAGDSGALHQALERLGVPGGEIEALDEAIDQDRRDSQAVGDEIGPATRTWLDGLRGKVAAGSIRLAEGATISVVGRAVAQFVGLG